MSASSRDAGGTGRSGPVPLGLVDCPVCAEPTVVNALGDGRLVCSCAAHREIALEDDGAAATTAAPRRRD